MTTWGTDHRPFAVVTGASSGIGEALARQFVRHGHDVLVAAEDDAIQAAADELNTYGIGTGGAAQPAQVDLATPEGVEGLAARIEGVGRPSRRPRSTPASASAVPSWTRPWRTTCAWWTSTSARRCTSPSCCCGPWSRAGGAGCSSPSIAATAPGPYHATYAASKAFVHSFAEGIRHELKGSGVSVTSLMPGPTETNFFERAGMTDTKVGRASKDDADEVAKDGYDALMAGRASVVAGSLANRLQAEVSTHLPDVVAAAAQARMTAPGSGR